MKEHPSKVFVPFFFLLAGCGVGELCTSTDGTCDGMDRATEAELRNRCRHGRCGSTSLQDAGVPVNPTDAGAAPADSGLVDAGSKVPVADAGSGTPATDAGSSTQATLLTVDQIISWRGDHALQHEIALPSAIDYYTWGQHGTEDNKSLPSGSSTVNAWLVVERDNSQLNTALNVRVNIRNVRIYYHRPSDGSWVLVSSGLPNWMALTTAPDTSGGYVDIQPIIESDGSYSFSVPLGGGLHMARGEWPPASIAATDGIVAVVEARLVGNAADIAAAKIGMEAGADYRDAAGSGGSIRQSGAGRFGRLTADWRAFSMLSSTLSDAQVRANPPPVQ